ncbi:hypothetical protein [Nocardia sp. NRRL WC-3656]|uniref:hypothetical protein n=1 Tax=Nocardia sp. NRRL WC-3656 TaxID=1463824 RepID=UPI00068B9AE0|nr:hypothetical protein [Nocardia sp. NRRL WC-3656]
MSDPTYVVVGDDGAPRGIVDVDKIQANATLLMYELSAAAGDDAEVDRICAEWAARLDPDAMGYTSAAALSLLTRNVLAPLIDVLEVATPGVEYRAKLAECREYTARLIGDGGGR